jgi:hypothetical protein
MIRASGRFHSVLDISAVFAPTPGKLNLNWACYFFS